MSSSLPTEPPPVLPATQASGPTEAEHPGDGLAPGQRRMLIVAAIVALLILVGLIVGAVLLVRNPAAAASLRDVFIIFMALEFMVIGVALVILIVQLAHLTNMLQHEIRPILQSTNETLNTVRGTTTFVSENLVQPVIKLNAYLAAFGQVVDSLNMFGRFGRRK
jgi:hypothetical protein